MNVYAYLLEIGSLTAVTAVLPYTPIQLQTQMKMRAREFCLIFAPTNVKRVFIITFELLCERFYVSKE